MLTLMLMRDCGGECWGEWLRSWCIVFAELEFGKGCWRSCGE